VSESDWFAVYVMWAYDNGFMKGINDSPMRFGPDDPLTRGMAVTVLYRMQNAVPPIAYDNPFDDVIEGEWYAEAVKWAYHNEIVSGYGDGSFGPGDFITREQMARIFHNYCIRKGIDVSIGEDTNILSYQDAFDISDWAFPALQWACGAGVITGKPGGYLDPAGGATRAEFATVLKRFMENCLATAPQPASIPK
jgi:hypothetical protein